MSIFSKLSKTYQALEKELKIQRKNYGFHTTTSANKSDSRIEISSNKSPMYNEISPMRSEEQVGNVQDWSLIIAEETQRLRNGEIRSLYIQSPMKISCQRICAFLRSIFKGEFMIYYSPWFIKIMYGNTSRKEKELKFFNSRLFYWPHNRELVVLRHSTSIPEDSKFKHAFLDDEIIETELAIHNVTTDLRFEDLVKVFPNLKDFSKNSQVDKIYLFFNTAKDALEAFHSGKDVLIGKWKVNVIFNRRRNERFGRSRSQ